MYISCECNACIMTRQAEGHAKPRGIQPRESENSERSTRGKDGRQKSALRKNCSAPEARLNARAGTSLSIAPLPTSYCTHLFYKHVLRTILGMGMCTEITAEFRSPLANQTPDRV